MAKQQQPKEDLIRDATALVQRIELRIAADTITIGFRDNGAASLFHNDEPAYHFNSENQLRRAYDNGLIKSVDGRLIKMVREHSEESVQLKSKPLTDQEQEEFLDRLATSCDSIQAAIKNGECTATRQFPEDADVLSTVTRWLRELKHPVEIATQPNL